MEALVLQTAGPQLICNKRVLNKNLKEKEFLKIEIDPNIQAKENGSGKPLKSSFNSKNVGGAVTRPKPLKRSYKSYGGYIPAMLHALECTDNIDEALAPWEAHLSAKERSIILKEQSNWERALQLFKWFQEKGCYEVNAIHYNILFRILGRAQEWDKLKKLWEDMVRNRVLPTYATYGTLIDVYGKADLKQEALLWLDHMMSHGLHVDEVTMCTVVNIFKKAREYERAAQFFRDWSSGKMSAKVPYQDKGVKRDCLPQISFKGFANSSGLLEGKVMVACNDGVHVQRPHTIHTYNTLIDTFGKAGWFKEASNVFHDMLKEGIIPNTITFNTMIHICGSHGHLEEADALMMKMEELHCIPNIRTYNTLISLHAENDNINKAFWYFKKMKEAGVLPDSVSYRTILYAFSIRQMVNEADVVIQEMDELGVPVDESSQTAVIRMYIGLGLLDKAWTWFERFHLDGRMGSECYAANIDAYGEQGYWLEAEKVFNCSQERGRKPSVIEFNVMIKSYGIAKVHDKTFNLLASMRSKEVVPDTCTYSSLIQMFASADRVDNCKHFIFKMQEAGFMPQCASFAAVIAACARLGRAAEAEKMYEWMLKGRVEANIVVYGSLIDAFAETGNVDKAVHYFNLMKDAGFAANNVVYGSLIKLYSKRGLLMEAQETFNMLKKLGNVVNIFPSNCMIDLYSRANMVNEAHEIFQVLKEKGQANEFSFSMMLTLYQKTGRLNEATNTAKEMLESGFLTDILSFNNVIGFYVADGRLQEAAKVLQIMLKLEVSPDETTCKIMGILLVKEGIPREVVKQLEDYDKSGLQHSLQTLIVIVYAIVGIDNDVGFFANSAVYSSLINLYRKFGFLKEAQETFKMMKKSGNIVDVFSSNCMIDVYARAGKVSEAHELFQDLKEKGQANKFSFAMMLSLYKKKRRFNEATEIAREMLELGFLTHVRSYNRVIGLYVADERLKEAAKVLQKMLKQGITPDGTTCKILDNFLVKGGIPRGVVSQLEISQKNGLPYRVQTLMVIVYSLVGMTKEALEASLDLEVSACNAIIYAFGSAGRINEAFAMFMNMQARGLEPDATTYTNMIVSYGKSGLLHGVRRMFYQMKQKGFQPNGSTFNAAIYAYRSAGRNDLARLVTQERDFTRRLQEHCNSK